MTTKLISLAGLLLMLSSPTFAAPIPDAPPLPSASQAVQTAPAPQLLAWQRVGSPLSLAT